VAFEWSNVDKRAPGKKVTPYCAPSRLRIYI